MSALLWRDVVDQSPDQADLDSVVAVLAFYLLWGRKHSALNDGGDGYIPTAVPGDDDVLTTGHPQDTP